MRFRDILGDLANIFHADGQRHGEKYLYRQALCSQRQSSGLDKILFSHHVLALQMMREVLAPATTFG